MTFTAEDKRKCAEREVMMRRRVYPGWVRNGRMNQAEANRQIAMMAEIAEEYRMLEVSAP